MVTREKCLAVLKAYFNEVSEKYGIQSMALFGSVARNEQKPDSDVDVLYEGAPNMLLRIKMQQELEDLLGVPVDLTRSRTSISESPFVEDIAQDLIFV